MTVQPVFVELLFWMTIIMVTLLYCYYGYCDYTFKSCTCFILFSKSLSYLPIQYSTLPSRSYMPIIIIIIIKIDKMVGAFTHACADCVMKKESHNYSK